MPRYVVCLTRKAREEDRREEMARLVREAGGLIVEGSGRKAMAVEMSAAVAKKLAADTPFIIVERSVSLELLPAHPVFIKRRPPAID